MFTPSRDEARRFLADAWTKYQAGQPLSGLEQIAASICALHPEYHPLLEQREQHEQHEQHFDRAHLRDYAPETGAINPFLHLSLHLAVAEQLSIDQPPGIRAAFTRLRAAHGDEHEALHALVECLGETLWQAQRLQSAPDAMLYLRCVEARR